MVVCGGKEVMVEAWYRYGVGVALFLVREGGGVSIGARRVLFEDILVLYLPLFVL